MTVADASPVLALPGAVASDRPDEGAVAHFGNPVGEQRALEAGRAIVELAGRAVLTVSGPDRLSWLDSITSQRLIGLPPGEPTELLVLAPTGRVEHSARVVDDGERTWLIVDRLEAAALLEFLQKMRFMLRVDLLDVSAEHAVIGSTVPLGDAQGVAGALGESTVEWRDPWDHIGVGGWQYSVGEHPGTAWNWYETVVPVAARDALAESAASGQVVFAGMLAAEALRIAAWRPRFAAEVDERTIPHELDWLRSAVHLDKGCYRGQETVAKVHNLGHPPRRLVMLHLDGSDSVLPVRGDEVVIGGDADAAVVGQVTSAALHHELGPIALAVVRRSTDASAVLRVRSAGLELAAAQVLIVPPEAGAVADVPHLPRLGAVQRTPRRTA